VADVPHLREKTYRVGFVARAAAIFRVEEIIIYSDRPGGDEDARFIATVLRYMETPQYLRRRLFPIKPELRYAGILPPLRTPNHPLESRVEDLEPESYRDGFVLQSSSKKSVIDLGFERPVAIPIPKLPTNKRVTVRITKSDGKVDFQIVSRDDVPFYWGYTVTVSNEPLGKTVKRGGRCLIVATSKYGQPIDVKLRAIAERWKSADKALILFGSPEEGLREILRREGLTVDDVADFTVNTIVEQGAETVRTEEAIYATLAILNTLR
jgi:predicted SPOUT superfamily RNA methylase MTH1